MKLKIIALFFPILFIYAFTAQDVMADQPAKASIVFTIEPKMHCYNCENKIKTKLRFEKGVTGITTNVKENIVTFVYDTRKTDPEKLIDAFGKIGYQATEANNDDRK